MVHTKLQKKLLYRNPCVSFWFRLLSFRNFSVLTAKTRIRPIPLPTRQQRRPFSRKTLPCRPPNRPYRLSECQHGKKTPGAQSNTRSNQLNYCRVIVWAAEAVDPNDILRRIVELAAGDPIFSLGTLASTYA